MSGNSLPPPQSLPEERSYPPRKRKSKPGSALPPLWSIAATVLVAAALAGCAIATFVALGSGSAARGEREVVLQVTAALASDTPALDERFATPSPTLALNSTAAPEQSIVLLGPTLVPTHTATSTAITVAVGTRIIVISQGGVNVRAAPGTTSERSFVANFNQTYDVIGGPERADDLTWWQIRNPQNNQTGWIAENDGLSDLIEVFIA
jgi:hypothetical protein